jgi:hypothetical protein
VAWSDVGESELRQDYELCRQDQFVGVRTISTFLAESNCPARLYFPAMARRGQKLSQLIAIRYRMGIAGLVSARSSA